MGMILTCLVVFLAPCIHDFLFAGVKAQGREVYGVGTHVCYLSVLVEVLGEHHGLRHGEPEFAGRLLLQG